MALSHSRGEKQWQTKRILYAEVFSVLNTVRWAGRNKSHTNDGGISCVPITILRVNRAIFTVNSKIRLREIVNVWTAVIGRTAQTTITEVMTKKCQNGYAQTLSYNAL